MRLPNGFAWVVWMAGVIGLCGVPMQAHAATRAWLDRDSVALGQSVTLNIETDQGHVDSPDYGPLQRDFRLSGHTSSRRFSTVNNVATTQVLFAVALEPRQAGTFQLPALSVGSERTAPLRLQVTAPAAITPAPARSGEPVFVEAQADVTRAYVQQAVGYVVRLYYATPLISGQLEQPAPDGADLQQIGQDREYTARIGSTRYNVVERRYLLIPERSGALVIPPARFRGQGVGGFFDDLFGDGRRALSANGPSRQLQVLPPPAHAPQPWLPLSGFELRYLDTPQQARAGAAADITLEATVDGASATQLPPLELEVSDGAQVFPDPPQVEESVQSGRPQVRITRRFSVVPATAGPLQVHGPRIAWWDVRAGQPRTASLPPLTLEVAADTSSAAPTGGTPSTLVSTPDASRTPGVAVPGVQGRIHPWALATAAFALLWLVTLAWALKRRAGPVPAGSAASLASEPRTSTALPRVDHARLREALAATDLGHIERILLRMAPTPAAGLDEVHDQLIMPAQREALTLLQQARWGSADVDATLQALRTAFAEGPRWRTTPASAGTRQELPALYPP